MKNRTSILVGTRHFFYALLVAVIFCGCEARSNSKQQNQNSDMFAFGIKTVEHDSCEYVIFKDNSRSSISMIHKQNCKFCAERSKK